MTDYERTWADPEDEIAMLVAQLQAAQEERDAKATALDDAYIDLQSLRAEVERLRGENERLRRQPNPLTYLEPPGVAVHIPLDDPDLEPAPEENPG